MAIEVKLCDEVMDKLKNKEGKVMAVQVAPAVRVSIGEEFGMAPGEIVVGRIVHALRKLGFDYVFDTNFGADLTIIEEASELKERVLNKKTLPLFTTCCPGWYRFVEQMFPEFFPHLSTVKSPQAMLGSLTKTYFAEKINKNPEDIFHVVIAPCVIKKYEATRKRIWVHRDKNIPNIDCVLTTREICNVIVNSDFDIKNLDREEDFDHPLGLASGGGAIFGTVGGVMEAMLRTLYYYINEKDLENFELETVRTTENFSEGKFKVNDDITVKYAIINGLSEAKKMLDRLKKDGSLPYDVVEVMACPLGCIGGAGQPMPVDDEVLQKRREAILEYQKGHKYHAAYQNPEIKQLYDEYLGEPLKGKARELLHADYKDRSGEQFCIVPHV